MNRTPTHVRVATGRPRRRGTAMVEFCLVLPLLMTILLLIVFFSHAMMRKQQVVVTDRHFAWRHAKHLPEPTDPSGQIDYARIRAQHLNGEPVSMSLSGGGHAPKDAQQGLAAAARQEGAEAGQFAADVVNTRFPGDVGYRTDVTYPPNTLPMDRFGRDIADRYFREGVPWQRKHVAIWQEVRDHFIADFDDRVTSRGANGLTDVVQNLYLRRW